MRKRTLSLSRETLTELTTDELTTLAGAANAATTPVKYCLTNISQELSCNPSCGSCWCSWDSC